MYEYGGEPPQSFDKSCIPLQFTGIVVVVVDVVVDDVVDDEVLELELDDCGAFVAVGAVVTRGATAVVFEEDDGVEAVGAAVGELSIPADD
jgi:hypothetical protein